MANEIPGMRAAAVMMQGPPEILNMGVRHVTEAMNVMNMSVNRLGAELAVPPALPAGLQLPGLPGAGTSAPPSAPAPAMFAKKSRLIK
jgi:hypothetical protein